MSRVPSGFIWKEFMCITFSIELHKLKGLMYVVFLMLHILLLIKKVTFPLVDNPSWSLFMLDLIYFETFNI